MYSLCSTCGSSICTTSNEFEFPNVQIFKPLLDQNIDGTDRHFTSKRAHVDCLKRHDLVCQQMDEDLKKLGAQLTELQKSVNELKMENEKLKTKVNSEPPLTSVGLAEALRNVSSEVDQSSQPIEDMSQAELVTHLEQKFEKRMEQVQKDAESKIESARKSLKGDADLTRQFDSDIETQLLEAFPEAKSYVKKIKAARNADPVTCNALGPENIYAILILRDLKKKKASRVKSSVEGDGEGKLPGDENIDPNLVVPLPSSNSSEGVNQAAAAMDKKYGLK